MTDETVDIVAEHKRELARVGIQYDAKRFKERMHRTKMSVDKHNAKKHAKDSTWQAK